MRRFGFLIPASEKTTIRSRIFPCIAGEALEYREGSKGHMKRVEILIPA